MAEFVSGDVVVAPFPFTDLQSSKRFLDFGMAGHIAQKPPSGAALMFAVNSAFTMPLIEFTSSGPPPLRPNDWRALRLILAILPQPVWF